jgi:hypothetical protein
MRNELERIWQEAIVAKFKVLSRNLNGRIEEGGGEPQPGYWVTWPIFELVALLFEPALWAGEYTELP